MTRANDVLSLFIFILLSAFGESLIAILGDRFPFPENCDGASGELFHRFGPGGTRLLAIKKYGVWTPAAGYTDRIGANSSVVFNRTVYNDGGGTYEFECGGETKIVQLKVVRAVKRTVPVGELVTLPCDYVTAGKSGLYVVWRKNGAILVKQKVEPGGGTGSAAGGRLSLPPAGLSDGDLSLRLSGAQLDDGGDYFCSVEDKDAHENTTIAVVRLTVREVMGRLSSTSPPPRDGGAHQTTPWKVSFGVVLALFLLSVAGFCWWVYSRRPGSTSGAMNGGHYAAVQMATSPHSAGA
ncbi:unnamed protein product [Menidia menidia]|uniref:(Atlantic silverside) hypothetical protein n=1 Tax=Menidia menidia TaxID=238744 RepID=A0A8S4BDP4_9TELE|nr:unnamed protein product [Menidia menidia]